MYAEILHSTRGQQRTRVRPEHVQRLWSHPLPPALPSLLTYFLPSFLALLPPFLLHPQPARASSCSLFPCSQLKASAALNDSLLITCRRDTASSPSASSPPLPPPLHFSLTRSCCSLHFHLSIYLFHHCIFFFIPFMPVIFMFLFPYFTIVFSSSSSSLSFFRSLSFIPYYYFFANLKSSPSPIPILLFASVRITKRKCQC